MNKRSQKPLALMSAVKFVRCVPGLTFSLGRTAAPLCAKFAGVAGTKTHAGDVIVT